VKIALTTHDINAVIVLKNNFPISTFIFIDDEHACIYFDVIKNQVNVSPIRNDKQTLIKVTRKYVYLFNCSLQSIEQIIFVIVTMRLCN